MITPTTELEALNIMLSSIDALPLSTMDEAVGTDAGLAKTILREVLKEVQTEGWHFNTEENYPLSPDVNGNIRLPYNCVRVDLNPMRYPQFDIVQRGHRLYDKRSHSYKFSAPVEATVVLILPFDEIPEAARRYIVIRATRIFQDRVISDKTLHAFTERDEYRARSLVMGADLETADYNILNGAAASSEGYRYRGFDIPHALRRK